MQLPLSTTRSHSTLAASLCLALCGLGAAGTAQATSPTVQIPTVITIFPTVAPTLRQCQRTPAAEWPDVIFSIVLFVPELSTLADLLRSTGLLSPLAERGTFTLYAPTNAAFAKLPASQMAALRSNPELLRDMLKYHISTEINGPRALLLNEVPTQFGLPLALRFKPGVGPKANQSVVSCQKVQGANGNVWLIDSVLQPQYR